MLSFQGHTIVGDATTPQLSAMIFGDQPENLKPEGRRGFVNSQQIDRWPSIIKDYKVNGYVTVHSEDEPWINSFNFRLRGFKEQPTFKYLRTWWKETRDLRNIDYTRSNSCPIEFAFDYVKKFYKEYPEELSLVFAMNSALTHNEPERVQMYDDGFIRFFKDLNTTKQLDKTIVVFFGDHGMREGGFRRTTQGKLEERLPLMTITLPPSFHKKYPREVNNLKRNSKVLTTPYDIHVTLKHLLSMSKGETPPEHRYGRSLFSDVSSLNRECGEAGITPFWCVCTSFEELNITAGLNNSTVQLVASEMVNTINQIIYNNSIAKAECQVLRLQNVIRAGKLINEQQEMAGFETYEIVFQTQPCGGPFEMTGEYNKKTKQTKTNKNISRINRYGDQPKCIQQKFPYLRKYCCCNSNT